MSSMMNALPLFGMSNYSFSAAHPTDLMLISTGYTLVTILIDLTTSVGPFKNELRESLISAIDSCRSSPRAENLLIRVVTFNSSIGIKELHGFKPLNDIDTNEYHDFTTAGMTNLFDAVYNAAQATIQYGKTLVDMEFDVNAALFIITDGADNKSTMTANSVKQVIDTALSGEQLESILSVLIEINPDNNRTELDEFVTNVGITQHISVKDTTPESLKRLARFVSQSISSQSQSLTSGGPSVPLTF